MNTDEDIIDTLKGVVSKVMEEQYMKMCESISKRMFPLIESLKESILEIQKTIVSSEAKIYESKMLITEIQKANSFYLKSMEKTASNYNRTISANEAHCVQMDKQITRILDNEDAIRKEKAQLIGTLRSMEEMNNKLLLLINSPHSGIHNDIHNGSK